MAGELPQTTPPIVDTTGGEPQTPQPVMTAPGTVINVASGQPQQNGQPPVAPQPVEKPSRAQGILHALADALGGPSKVQRYNPTTGEVETEDRSTGQRVLRGIGTVLRGAAAGAGEHGPGHVGAAAAAGANAQANAMSTEWNQKQKAMLDNAQMYRDHLQNVLVQHQIGAYDQELQKSNAEWASSIIRDKLDDPESHWQDGGGYLSAEELQQRIADYGKQGIKSTSITVYPDEPAPNPDGKGTHQTYHLLIAPGNGSASAPAAISHQTASNLSELTGEQVTAGQKVPGSTLYGAVVANTTNSFTQNTVYKGLQSIGATSELFDKDGKFQMSKLDDAEQRVATRAFKEYPKYLAAAGGDPSKALQLMTVGNMTTTEQSGVAGGKPSESTRTSGKGLPARPELATFIGEKMYGGHADEVSNKLASNKASALEQAKQDVENNPTNQAAKARQAGLNAAATEPVKESAEEAKEARAEARKNRQTQGYAEDENGQVYITNKADAVAKGHTFEEMKPGDINKDKQGMRMLNDVQDSTTTYTEAAKNAVAHPLSTKDYLNIHSILDKAGVGDIGIGDWKVELPAVSHFAESLNREVKSEAYANLSPQAKGLMNAYIAQMSAIPAYQKALTGIGRSNKEMLDLELANVADPSYLPKDILEKQGRMQQNIDRAVDGYPSNMVGIPNMKATATSVQAREQNKWKNINGVQQQQAAPAPVQQAPTTIPTNWNPT